jgi:hypothetical protein
MDVGELYFGGGNEVERGALPLGLEEVVLELGELPRAGERIGVGD